MLRKETVQALGDWIFQDVLCHWGTLVEIVSDNGKPFVAALSYLERKYHIKHIQISGYNSRANGIVEQSHFNVHQALFKAADGKQSRWVQVAHSVFWSKHVTPHKCMGCSPYFAATGVHPLLPFDMVEANYLLPPPNLLLSTTNLIARQAIALQKRQDDLTWLRAQVHDHCNKAAICFKREHLATIHDYDFKSGDLILVCNMAIEKALNRKMQPHYFGPMVVVSRNKGGAYIVCNLDGTLLHSLTAAFQVVPYFTHDHIDIPNLKQHIDVSVTRLHKLEASTSVDPDEPEHEAANEKCSGPTNLSPKADSDDE